MNKWAILALWMLFLMPSQWAVADEEHPAQRIAILYSGEAHGEIHPCG